MGRNSGHQSCRASVIAFAPPYSPPLYLLGCCRSTHSHQSSCLTHLLPVDNPYEQKYAQVWRTMRLQRGKLRNVPLYRTL